MRLNRWQRIGVVISVVWALSAAWYMRNSELEAAHNFFDFAYRVCMETQATTLKNCLDQATHDSAVWFIPNWGDIAFGALSPIPLFWFISFVFIRVFRWVRAGSA